MRLAENTSPTANTGQLLARPPPFGDNRRAQHSAGCNSIQLHGVLMRAL